MMDGTRRSLVWWQVWVANAGLAGATHCGGGVASFLVPVLSYLKVGTSYHAQPLHHMQLALISRHMGIYYANKLHDYRKLSTP
jgi:hypothetical protein